jgi:hypothetical protein
LIFRYLIDFPNKQNQPLTFLQEINNCIENKTPSLGVHI